jgi:hypothetical protein
MPDAQTLAHDAKAAGDEVKRVVGDIAGEAQGQVETLVDQAKEKVADATQQAKGMASAQKDLFAEQLGDVARAATRVADDMDQQNGPSAPYMRMLADNAEKLSDTIREKDVEDILAMAQDFGRRQPVAFLGAAALLGFAASRFMTATARRSTAPSGVPEGPASAAGSVASPAGATATSFEAGRM